MHVGRAGPPVKESPRKESLLSYLTGSFPSLHNLLEGTPQRSSAAAKSSSLTRTGSAWPRSPMCVPQLRRSDVPLGCGADLPGYASPLRGDVGNFRVHLDGTFVPFVCIFKLQRLMFLSHEVWRGVLSRPARSIVIY